MQFLYIGALGAVMATALVTVAVQQTHDQPPAVNVAAREVDQYRVFMYVASQYMKGYSSGAATIAWSTLRTVATAPSGAKNIDMPANWNVVAASDNSWVACTPMQERSIGIMQQLPVSGGLPLTATTSGTRTYVVVGSNTAAAASCN